MAQICVNDLTFYYDGSFDNIFDHVSFSVDTNWKLGFIGRNGKGKTTFLNLLLGKLEYLGSIEAPVVFDYFPYVVSAEQMEQPAAEFMETLKPTCESWRVIWELESLGEAADILYRPYRTLSHGERTKVLLAVLFSGENEFLLIDEPTNHLDRAARETVQNYLSAKKGFILVSHDRELLDACTDHCLVLNRGSIQVCSGSFSTWWENKQRQDQFVTAENEKHRREIQKLRQSAARTSAWADQSERSKIGFDPNKEPDRPANARAYIGAKTKKMHSRVKQMERRVQREIEEQEGLLQDVENPVDLKLVQLTHHKNVLVRAKDYGLGYEGCEHPVFRGLSFELRQGQRVSLSGKNGSGKSTLIHMLLQNSRFFQEPLKIWEAGSCETAAGLVISYAGQDASGLRGSLSDYCLAHCLDRSLFYAILRQLGFEQAQLSKNIEDYSQGQKKKVLLAASLMTPAHLYIWDEPLNYIDIFSRMQLEKLLLTYQPTMLFVEHDRRFCEKIATSFISLDALTESSNVP